MGGAGLAAYTAPRLVRAAREERRAARATSDLVVHFDSALADNRRHVIELQVRVDTLEKKLSSGSTPPPPTKEQGTMEEIRRAVEEVRRSLIPRAAGSVMQQASRMAPATSSTERAILELLGAGPKTAPEIQRQLGRSREHTARVLKQLYGRGLVTRVETARPYVYRIGREGTPT